MDKQVSKTFLYVVILYISTYPLVCSTTTTAGTTSNSTMQTTSNTTNSSSMRNTTTPSPIPSNTTAPMAVNHQESLNDQKLENSVTLKFYSLKESKFQDENFQKAVASEITSYCQQMDTECRIKSSAVEFLKSDVDILNITQDARNLNVTISVVYPYNTSIDEGILVLPRALLKAAVTERRENIGDAVGTSLIQIDGGKMYHIKADNALNIIISLVSLFVTIILLVIVLLIRSNFKKREDDDRKEFIQTNLRRKEQEGTIYKIRPGPEPIERTTSERSKKPYPPDNFLVNRQGTPKTNHHTRSNGQNRNGNATEAGKGKVYPASLDNTTVSYLSEDNNDSWRPTGAAPANTGTHQMSMSPGIHQSTPKLPPLDNSSATESPSAEKKKKKKKRRKHREQERTEDEAERGDVSVVTFNNTAYDE